MSKEEIDKSSDNKNQESRKRNYAMAFSILVCFLTYTIYSAATFEKINEDYMFYELEILITGGLTAIIILINIPIAYLIFELNYTKESLTKSIAWSLVVFVGWVAFLYLLFFLFKSGILSFGFVR